MFCKELDARQNLVIPHEDPRLGARRPSLARSRPQQRLCDDHLPAVERRSGTSVQAIPNSDRLADPMAEGRVIGAGQDTVNRQAIRRRTHAASIPDRPSPPPA